MDFSKLTKLNPLTRSSVTPYNIYQNDSVVKPPDSNENETGNGFTDDMKDKLEKLKDHTQDIENLSNRKVDKVNGKELSSNDFTDSLKQKLVELKDYTIEIDNLIRKCNETSVPTQPTKIPALKILMIGNSFSGDATQYLHDICASLNIDVEIGILYRGGSTLNIHLIYAKDNSNSWSFYSRKAVNGIATQTITNDVSFSVGVKMTNWDIITFQQRSRDSDDYSTYQPALNELKSITNGLKTNANVKYAMHQTWAYAKSLTDNQPAMYNGIMNAHQRSMQDENIGLVIPNGTAVQNARQNSFLNSVQDELTEDGYHLGEIGDYLTSLSTFECLLSKRHGIDILKDVSYKPSGVSSLQQYLAKISAITANINPFAITNI